jgi:hypothetical protein
MIDVGSALNEFQEYLPTKQYWPFIAITLVILIVIMGMSTTELNAVVAIGIFTNMIIITNHLHIFSDKSSPGSVLTEQLSSVYDKNNDVQAAMSDNEGSNVVNSAEVNSAEVNSAEVNSAEVNSAEVNSAEASEYNIGKNVDISSLPPTDVPLHYPGAIDFDHLYQNSTSSDAKIETDDEIAIYDGDEQNTYQVRARNVPERVWGGALKRQSVVNRYVKEELDEEEDRVWWGKSQL